jgi:hypothetical protein
VPSTDQCRGGGWVDAGRVHQAPHSASCCPLCPLCWSGFMLARVGCCRARIRARYVDRVSLKMKLSGGPGRACEAGPGCAMLWHAPAAGLRLVETGQSGAAGRARWTGTSWSTTSR